MNSHQHYDKYKRDKEAKAFYRSKEWLKVRLQVLERDNHLCQYCFKKKRITPADMVHHIKELKDHPELALDLENLESLCNGCHAKMHPEKGFRGRKKSHSTKSSKVRVIVSKPNEELF